MAERGDRPNILLLMTDQQRGDALGLAGHPVLQTPYLDALGAEGVFFRRAYSACPICVAARRTLMTGRRPVSHGVFANYNTRLFGPTLPGELAAAGYQTHLVGKLHLWPLRARYGFQSMDWADSPFPRHDDDYQRWLRREGFNAPGAAVAHGANGNGWVARPFHLEERFHFTNWCADRAIEFLERRDPTAPFFLKVSFHQPHQPCTPPRDYYERYMAMDLPEPEVGDWARVFDRPQRGLSVVAGWRVCLEPALMRQYRAAYYGCINHIDDQIGRILAAIPRNTIVVFTSDHGEMLGDHQWTRKRNAYEASAHIPLLMRFPAGLGIRPGQACDQPVELMDLMPTLLETAGVPVPESVEGRSVLPLVRGEPAEWRAYLHGECSDVATMNSGMQYLTDGRRKYIWFPGQGREQYFDLEADPREMRDLAASPDRAAEIAIWRERLVRELEGRPEGFVESGRLAKLSGPTAPCLPGYEQTRTASL